MRVKEEAVSPGGRRDREKGGATKWGKMTIVLRNISKRVKRPPESQSGVKRRG